MTKHDFRFTPEDHERMKATLDSLSDNPTEEEAEAVLQACGTSGKEVVNEFIERLLKENLELKQELARRAAVTAPRVDRALYSELIHIAAELARGTDFLSTCAEDMNPRLKRADILKTAERQGLQLKDWANRVRQVADQLSAATSSPTPAESDEANQTRN